VGAKGRVVGLDFSPGMIEVAERRQAKDPKTAGTNLTWVCRGAETLPIDGPKFDWVVSGFALRGLYENIDRILDGIRESLDTGGRVALLDLTEPRNPVLRFLYKTFFYSWVAFLGAVLFGKNYPVAYLPDSSSRFLKASEFTEKLKSRGFRDVTARSFVFGSVTLYRAKK
jgi:demethylmenaquinone methyltransferase/2-methoxy-6-polyprenyl-1,4-benzoquinol methylase